MKSHLLTILLILFSQSVFSQLVNYSGFDLNDVNGKVLVSITIDSGSICQGIQLEHSIDSLNFEKIDEIEGVCGSSSVAKSYSFLHPDPEKNAVNYYRLVFGISQRSEIKSIYIRYIVPGEIQVFPMPAENDFSVYFSNPSLAKATCFITDQKGKQVVEIPIINSDWIPFTKSDFKQGIYFIQIIDENQNKSTGKFTVF